jgi:hypothetical protein
LATSQIDTVVLSTGSGEMLINMDYPVSPGQMNGQLVDFYTTSSQYVGVTSLSGVQITGIAGQFSCTASSQLLVEGSLVTISGTNAGTGSITGYSTPKTYKISATNGSTTFTLVNTNDSAIVTSVGTTTGLTLGVSTSIPDVLISIDIAVLKNLTSGDGIITMDTTSNYFDDQFDNMYVNMPIKVSASVGLLTSSTQYYIVTKDSIEVVVTSTVASNDSLVCASTD